ncbi:MAG: ABC transporter ATP-binding protein [Gemmobacter sp.]|uniref:ABC transporter ATP-binding protein n=1 Tax=Gemmobacter sp. TaxID=1898957 RepID=UPI00391CDEB4
MTLLSIRDLSVALPGGGPNVLQGLNLDLDPAAIVAVIGESGAGKTMLLRSICGALPEGARRSGSVLLRSGARVVPVLQAPMAGLSPVRRIGAQIADAAARDARDPGELLEILGLPRDLVARYPQELSGGMQVRAALARALASGAELILADEPTAALDGPTASSVLETLGALRAAGRSVVIVTHDPALAAKVSDRIAVLRSGRLVETGPAAQVVAAPVHPYTRAIMLALPARAGRLDALPGAPATRLPARAPAADPVLALQGVGLVRPKGPGLAGIDLNLHSGEVLALCGASGSGKTTLARIAARLDQPGSGSIVLDGQDIGTIPPARFSRDPRRSRVQMVFQDPADSFLPWQSVRQSICDPVAPDPGALAEACRGAGLDPALLDRKPRALSQGQLARAALVRATVGHPQVLVLDEPTAALDAPLQAGVLHYLDALRRAGMALLLVTHDLHVARLLADRLIVLDAGRIVEAGPVAHLLAQPAHPATQALVAAMT